MNKFLIDKTKELDVASLGRILQKFLSTDLGTLNKRYNYYMGKLSILMKKATDVGKPCNKIVCNYVKNIIETYEGYSLGNPVSYSSPDANFTNMQEVLDYNDVADTDSELMRLGLIFGRGCEICYTDEDGKLRFKTLDPRGCIPVYANDLSADLVAAIRFYKEDLVDKQNENYIVEVYDNVYKTIYKSSAGFNSFEQLNRTPHYFKQVPVTFFSLNEEEEGIADTIFSLQDAYNALISDSIDDWDSFVDSLLLIKGCTADEDDLRSMKTNRVLMLDSDCDAAYITKTTSDTQISNLLETVETKIREMSACPNFSSETFGTSSGIAIRYRCMQMDNKIAAILNNFKKALQRRLELLSGVLAMLDEEVIWRDTVIEFHKNIPEDLGSTYQNLNTLRGLVSDETLLSQIQFVKDPKEELKRIQEEQQRKMDLYSFEHEHAPNDEEDDDLQ